MSISQQEGAGEFISIKQIWLSQINRCNEALTNYVLKAKHDDDLAGMKAAISSVEVLILNLINFGDAPIKDEFQQWWKDNHHKFNGKYEITIAKAKLERIIDILNKYQMLHDSLPRGYSNVTMEGIDRRDLIEQE